MPRRSTRPPPPAPSRAPLSRERIADAALALIEADGLPAFSTRRLGEALGCEAMSIYHHFPSKQHLLDALVERALAGVEVPAPGPDPAARLRAVMHAYRAMARRMPALFSLVALHRLNTPWGVGFIERVLALVRALVPDDELAARHFRVMGYYLVGAGLDETAGYARGPSAAEPVSDDHIRRECPRLVAAAPFFQPSQWDATFALGVDALIRAAEADAARLRRTAKKGDAPPA